MFTRLALLYFSIHCKLNPSNHWEYSPKLAKKERATTSKQQEVTRLRAWYPVYFPKHFTLLCEKAFFPISEPASHPVLATNLFAQMTDDTVLDSYHHHRMLLDK